MKKMKSMIMLVSVAALGLFITVPAFAEDVPVVSQKSQNELSETKVLEGSISGMIAKASDILQMEPVEDAMVSVIQNGMIYTTVAVDDSGDFLIEKLPLTDYVLEITAEGFLPFTYYVTLEEAGNLELNKILLVSESEAEMGTASGDIYNESTNRGANGVTLSFRKGWNNTEYGEIVAETATNDNGGYSVKLPLGNYTAVVEKAGYSTAVLNVVVSEEKIGGQSSSIYPLAEGSSYEIIVRKPEGSINPVIKGYLYSGKAFSYYCSFEG